MTYLYSVNGRWYVDYFYTKGMLLCVTKHGVYAFAINTQVLIYPTPFDIGVIPVIKEEKYLNIESNIDNAINIIFKCLLTSI